MHCQLNMRLNVVVQQATRQYSDMSIEVHLGLLN